MISLVPMEGDDIDTHQEKKKKKGRRNTPKHNKGHVGQKEKRKRDGQYQLCLPDIFPSSYSENPFAD